MSTSPPHAESKCKLCPALTNPKEKIGDFVARIRTKGEQALRAYAVLLNIFPVVYGNVILAGSAPRPQIIEPRISRRRSIY